MLKKSMKKQILGFKTPLIAIMIAHRRIESVCTKPKKRRTNMTEIGAMRMTKNGIKMTKMTVKTQIIRFLAVIMTKRTRNQRILDIRATVSMLGSMTASNSTPHLMTITVLPNNRVVYTTCLLKMEQEPITITIDPALKAVSLATTLSPRPASMPNEPTKKSKSRGDITPSSRRHQGKRDEK